MLLKQPDAAGEAFRKPEATAEEHFKNVKTPLKALPTSELSHWPVRYSRRTRTGA